MSTREIVNVSKRMAAGDSRRDGTALARKKEAQLLDRQSAMADYEAARAAQRRNMERLRALRLARDAAAPPQAPAKVSSGVSKRRAKRAATNA